MLLYSFLSDNNFNYGYKKWGVCNCEEVGGKTTIKTTTGGSDATITIPQNPPAPPHVNTVARIVFIPYAPCFVDYDCAFLKTQGSCEYCSVEISILDNDCELIRKAPCTSSRSLIMDVYVTCRYVVRYVTFT